MGRIAVVCVAVLAAFAVFAGVRQEASSETYSQVVDNSDEERFAASRSWKKSGSGEGIHGDDYRLAQPARKGAHALFEVAIPADGVYAVYVRWPERPGLNDEVPVGVETAYGTEWTEVNQREDGGLWVRIGEFEMRRDEKFPVRISHNTKGEGKVAADAIKVERISSYGEPKGALGASRGAQTQGERATSATGSRVVAEARKYIGTRYLLGGPGVCRPYKTMDCTCLTKTAFMKVSKRLPDVPASQLRYGTAVSKANLRPGDLVFHKEDGRTITHVSIYSGNGKIVHASSYFGKVVESEMRYLRGYYAARRLV